jgi:hypothetical protein
MELISTLGVILVLSLIHIFAGKFLQLEGVPRNRWLSIAGGSSVAYVCIHLLPEIIEGQKKLLDKLSWIESLTKHPLLLVLLAGLVLFYGLERIARRSDSEERSDMDSTSRVFWLHIISFGIYNALVGYVVKYRAETEGKGYLLFASAMALHFMANDHALSEHHKDMYKTKGRWVLAVSVLIGWIVGSVTDISELVIIAIVAFLGGGIILNVFKEELPKERESRFLPFLLGVGIYTAVAVFERF